MRAFVQLRHMLLTNDELTRKVSDLQKRYDKNFKDVFDVLRQLIETPAPPHRKIGFRSDDK